MYVPVHIYACGLTDGWMDGWMWRSRKTDTDDGSHSFHIYDRYAANASMGDSAFQDSDGDLLIVPQLGCVTIYITCINVFKILCIYTFTKLMGRFLGGPA